MNLPTFQQAIDAANRMLQSDEAIVSVVIRFRTESGLAFEAIWDGLHIEVKRLAD
jgi:hypothetical protein